AGRGAGPGRLRGAGASVASGGGGGGGGGGGPPSAAARPQGRDYSSRLQRSPPRRRPLARPAESAGSGPDPTAWTRSGAPRAPTAPSAVILTTAAARDLERVRPTSMDGLLWAGTAAAAATPAWRPLPPDLGRDCQRLPRALRAAGVLRRELTGPADPESGRSVSGAAVASAGRRPTQPPHALAGGEQEVRWLDKAT